jgi:hypothetical protein
MDTTLFSIVRELAAESFNYPDIEMCSDGDVITYLKNIPKEDKIIDVASNGIEHVIKGAGWFLQTSHYRFSVYDKKS